MVFLLSFLYIFRKPHPDRVNKNYLILVLSLKKSSFIYFNNQTKMVYPNKSTTLKHDHKLCFQKIYFIFEASPGKLNP